MNQETAVSGDESSCRQKYYGFMDGIPTAPAVAKFKKTWPALKPGDRIPYDDLEQAIGIKWRTQRWKSFVRALQSSLKKDGIDIQCDAGKALYVPTPEQTFADTPKKIDESRRGLTKMLHRVAAVIPENEQQAATQIHQARLLDAKTKDLRKARMNSLPSTKVAEQVKMIPPKSSGSAAD